MSCLVIKGNQNIVLFLVMGLVVQSHFLVAETNGAPKALPGIRGSAESAYQRFGSRMKALVTSADLLQQQIEATETEASRVIAGSEEAVAINSKLDALKSGYSKVVDEASQLTSSLRIIQGLTNPGQPLLLSAQGLEREAEGTAMEASRAFEAAQLENLKLMSEKSALRMRRDNAISSYNTETNRLGTQIQSLKTELANYQAPDTSVLTGYLNIRSQQMSLENEATALSARIKATKAKVAELVASRNQALDSLDREIETAAIVRMKTASDEDKKKYGIDLIERYRAEISSGAEILTKRAEILQKWANLAQAEIPQGTTDQNRLNKIKARLAQVSGDVIAFNGEDLLKAGYLKEDGLVEAMRDLAMISKSLEAQRIALSGAQAKYDAAQKALAPQRAEAAKKLKEEYNVRFVNEVTKIYDSAQGKKTLAQVKAEAEATLVEWEKSAKAQADAAIEKSLAPLKLEVQDQELLVASFKEELEKRQSEFTSLVKDPKAVREMRLADLEQQLVGAKSKLETEQAIVNSEAEVLQGKIRASESRIRNAKAAVGNTHTNYMRLKGILNKVGADGSSTNLEGGTLRLRSSTNETLKVNLKDLAAPAE